MCGDLEISRKHIASIDMEIVRLISERTDIAGTIGSFKKAHDMPITDEEIERNVIDRYRSMSSECGISEDDLERVAKLLIEIAKKKEME